MGMRRLTALLAGLAICVHGGTFAQTPDAQQQRDALKGFPGVALIVEDLGDDARRDGLTAEKVTADIEERLNTGGVRIFKRGEPAPTLYVNIIPRRSDIGIYKVEIEIDVLQLYQPLPVNRETVLQFLWQRWTEHQTDRRQVDNTRYVINDFVDQFVADWLMVNPRY